MNTKNVLNSILAIVLIPLLFFVVVSLGNAIGTILIAILYYHLPISELGMLKSVITKPGMVMLWISAVIGECLPAIILYLIFIKKKYNIFKKSYFKNFQFKNFTATIILSLGMSTIIITIINIMFNGTGSGNTVGFDVLLSKISIAGIFTSSILAPIIEELVFRGFLFSILKNNMSVKRAIIIQALVFGIVHFIGDGFSSYGIIQGIYTIILGLLFAVILEKTNSFYNNIIAHITFNIMGVTVLNLLSTIYYNIYVYIIIGIILTIISLFMFKKSKK